MLRPLWGKRATVQGMVHFKANGQPRLIEARRISTGSDGDAIFEKMPEAEIRSGKISDLGTPEDRFRAVSRTSATILRRVDPMILWGAWPGDEPVEELLAALD